MKGCAVRVPPPGPGPQHGFVGALQAGWGPEHWGVTLAQMEELMTDPSYVAEEVSGSLWVADKRGSTMREVVQQIVIRQTAGTGLGYAMNVNCDSPLRASVMVSHAWDETYHQLLLALKDAGVHAVGAVWVCALAIYQPEDRPEVSIAAQLGEDPLRGPFAAVLRQADLMVPVFTMACDIYTRLWCVFEMFVAQDLGIEIQMAQFMSPKSQDIQMPFLEYCRQPVDSKSARCGRPDAPMNRDEQLIRGHIEATPGGYAAIDSCVERMRLHALKTTDFLTVLFKQDSSRPLSPKIGMILDREIKTLSDEIEARLAEVP